MSDQKLQWIRERPYLCVAPYIKYDFRVRHVGFSVSCCCNLDVGYSDKSSTTALVDEVREAMDNKQTHPACWRCHEEEERGHISERVRSLLGRHMHDLVDFDNKKLIHPEIEVGMKFSNLCNLACRSCNTQDSSTFAKITGRPVQLPEMEIDQSEVPEHWDIIIDQIQNTYQSISKQQQLIIHPIGGETVLQPGVYKLLDWAIEKDIAKDIMLRVTTSFATPISDELLEKFLHFKQIILLNSIDSVGDNYHHVRWPAKFEKVERNLDSLIELRRRYPAKFPMIGVLPTFSLNNIFYMPEILDFWDQWFRTHRIYGIVITTHLYTPEFLSFDILPQEYRSKLAQLLEQCRDHPIFKTSNNTKSLQEYILATLEILAGPGESDEEKFTDYLRFSADYDRRTGSDSFHGNKKFFDLLQPHHLEIYHQQYKSTNVSIPIYYKDSYNNPDL